jgi:hypothetical protein
MSFVKNPLQLPNSYSQDRIAVHKFKHCGKCNEDRPPEGGVQMSRDKWYCVKCWTVRSTSPKKKPS